MDLAPDKTVREIVSRLATIGEGVVKVEGTWGSFARLLAAHISKSTSRPILYVCPHIDDADKAADDLRTFGAQKVETLPAWEGEEDLADATDEIRAERLRIVSRIAYCVSRGEKNKVVIAVSVQALCQPVPRPDALEAGRLKLAVEKEVSPEKVCKWLVDNGFERVDAIDLPGQFARRGGIVDIYAPLISGEGVRLPRRPHGTSPQAPGPSAGSPKWDVGAPRRAHREAIQISLLTITTSPRGNCR